MSSACADDSATENTDAAASTGSSGGGDAMPTGDDTDGTTLTSDSTGDGEPSGTGEHATSAPDTDGGESTDGGSTGAADTGATSAASEDSSGSGGVRTVCDPMDLGSALGEVATGTTVGGGDDVEVPCVKLDAEEVEFLWTAPSSAQFQIDTFGSAYDTALVVLADGCDGRMLECNDDLGIVQSSVALTLDAGDTILVAVDGFGGAASDFVLNINTGAPGDCCVPSSAAGCEDPGCEGLVCGVDPDCCNVAWDPVCALELAPEMCPQCGDPGSCCATGPAPGCDDEDCQALVCAAMPECCDDPWAQDCVDMAFAECETCGNDCCQEGAAAGCALPTCEATVCAADPTCCSDSWSPACVAIAETECAGCIAPSPCCYPGFSPGCDEKANEACVCGAFPECCIGPWSQMCVDAMVDHPCDSCDPPDQTCVDQDLASALGEVATGSSAGAGDDEAASCGGAGGEDRVFLWTSPATATYVIDTVGSDYAQALELRYPDCAGPSIECVAAGGMSQSITIDVPSGVGLVIAVDGDGAASGDYVLNINPA